MVTVFRREDWNKKCYKIVTFIVPKTKPRGKTNPLDPFYPLKLTRRNESLTDTAHTHTKKNSSSSSSTPIYSSYAHLLQMKEHNFALTENYCLHITSAPVKKIYLLSRKYTGNLSWLLSALPLLFGDVKDI